MHESRSLRSLILTLLLIGSVIVNVYLGFLVIGFPEAIIDESLQTQESIVQGDPGGTAVVQGFATLQGPAVIERSEGSGFFLETVTEGTMIDISVEIRSGMGRVLVDTEPLMGVIFQDAAKTAVEVAENMTGTSLAGYDVIFSVTADEEIPAVDGPSAGTLMTTLVLSTLDQQTLRQDVTLTGTIDSSGHVGAIGGVLEKAEAAKESGKSLLLLPRENAQLVQYVQSTTTGRGRFYIPRVTTRVIDAKSYIEQEIGIEVEYVDSVSDVMEYMEG